MTIYEVVSLLPWVWIPAVVHAIEPAILGAVILLDLSLLVWMPIYALRGLYRVVRDRRCPIIR